MTTNTYFLQPTGSGSISKPNYINAFGTTSVFNINQSSAFNYTWADAQTWLAGGLASAIANSQALSLENPGFNLLATDTQVVGIDGGYLGLANSNAAILGTYQIRGNQPFSFEFAASLNLTSKEISNSRAEYSQGSLSTGFYVVDITNVFDIKVVDFFSLDSELISSAKKGDAKWESSKRVSLQSTAKNRNVGGNDAADFVQADVFGRYSRSFAPGTQLAIIKVEKNFTTAFSDGLINKLGSDVLYGTIHQDNLKAGDTGSKIYASLGDDTITGGKGNDILEGGAGKDLLIGNQGNDSLYGGEGDDILIGGLGNDVLVGGLGADTFIFKRGESLRKGEYDIVEDFEVGIDRVLFPDWPFYIGQLTQTNQGTLLTSVDSGQVLFKGVSLVDLQGAIWWSDFKAAG